MTQSPTYYTLPNSFIFCAEGKDATRYLHNRLTNDIKKLPVGQSCLAAALTPQGKTEGFFTCLRKADSSYLLQCDGGNRDTVQAALRRYIVADRVSIDLLEQPDIVIHCSSQLTTKIRLIAKIEDEIKSHLVSENSLSIQAIIPRNRIGSDGFDLWVSRTDPPFSELNQTLSEAHQLGESAYQQLRLSSGSPQFPDELNDSHLLTEAPVEGIVSHNKGCYVGQEVIERVASRGATPRLLARFLCDSKEAVPINTPLFIQQPEGPMEKIGEVCSSVLTDKGAVGFASVKRQTDESAPILIGEYRGNFSWLVTNHPYGS
jgi:folate-binding protein YgfZ